MTKTVYWSNLFRLRFWFFVFGGALAIGIAVGIIFPTLGGILFLLLPIPLAWFWIHTQMSCRHCGRLLATTKVSGPILKCPSCHEPTDLALEQSAEEKVHD